MYQKTITVAAIVASAFTVISTAAVIDFGDLTVPGAGYENGENLTGAFTSGGASFNNYFDTIYGSWEGFAYSTEGDTTTAGYLNQYSVFTGGGSDAAGGAVPGNAFAVGYVGYATIPTITFAPGESRPLSLRVTNTSYAALSILDGYFGAKKFGGITGNDPDFFKLTVTALDAVHSTIGALDVFLADYRFADNAQDYLLRDWTLVDLSSFGAGVSELQFTLASSDNHPLYGMNTPGYFAIDNVVAVPEPGSGALWLTGLVACGARRRRS